MLWQKLEPQTSSSVGKHATTEQSGHLYKLSTNFLLYIYFLLVGVWVNWQLIITNCIWQMLIILTCLYCIDSAFYRDMSLYVLILLYLAKGTGANRYHGKTQICWVINSYLLSNLIKELENSNSLIKFNLEVRIF